MKDRATSRAAYLTPYPSDPAKMLFNNAKPMRGLPNSPDFLFYNPKAMSLAKCPNTASLAFTRNIGPKSGYSCQLAAVEESR